MMPGPRKLRTASLYGTCHLRAINEDVQTEESYTRAMRSDMNIAIVLMQHAPAMVRLVETLVDYVAAGCEDLETSGKQGRRILAALEAVHAGR